MKTEEVVFSLKEIFIGENWRIVFWHDPDEEFAETVTELTLPDVTTLRVDQVGFLELKTRLEITEPNAQFLLYAPTPEPPLEQDWLLDIRLYSRIFRADRASLLLNELGLTHQTLRAHLANRKAFFKSAERTAKLKKLVQPTDLEEALDWKMLAVVTKAPQHTPFSVLTQLLREITDSKPVDLSQPPKTWAEVEKYGLGGAFWDGIGGTFGFHRIDGAKNPLHDLLLWILVTDLSAHIHGETPKSIKHLVLSEKSNCSVFVSQWSRDIQEFASFRTLSGMVGTELKVRELVAKIPGQELADTFTFEEVERRVLSTLRDTLISRELLNHDDFRELVRQRRDGVWVQVKIADSTDENPYDLAYQALEDAHDLLLLREHHAQGFSFPSVAAMFEVYTNELHRFDSHHRRFLAAADRIELCGWDILKNLRSSVTDCYEEWYLDQLAANWGTLIEGAGEKSLFKKWEIEKVWNQQQFYVRTVQPILKKNPRNKVFVIISDALRYEAAAELTSKLNQQNRVKASISAMLGVVPSYTGLGMAALLPHTTLKYMESGTLEVDGLPCGSLQDRDQILGKHNGMALKAGDLLGMNQQEGRETIQGARLVYIYHDRIDSVGDKARTERQTPGAVGTAIDELSSLVRYVINVLNGSHVFVTADHGFLFQEKPLSALDKSELAKKPDNAFIAKKRFILGHGLKKDPKAWQGFTRDTAGTDDDTEFWVPKPNNRFHFVGGAQFTHGGAMLQEIVVPLITIRELEGDTAKKATVRKVGISLLGSSRRVVNNMQKFEFIQTEKISERCLPVTVTVSLRDGEAFVSNEVTLTFNSDSDNMDERKRIAKIMLKKGTYDKKKEYHLVVRDAETQIELDRITFAIDLAIMNDF